MKKFFGFFGKVVGQYSIEERVISIIAVLVLFFSVAQSVYYGLKGSKVFEDRSSFTLAFVSDRTVLINPLYADLADTNREISSLVFSGLMKYDPKTKSFVDDLGHLTISDDKKEYKFILKDNLKWHDGEPLTADDVVFTYDLIQNPDFQNPVLKANFAGVTMKKEGDKIVSFNLTSPNSFFVSNLSVGILPKHSLEQVDAGNLPVDDFNLSPIGSGPYKVQNALEYFDDGRQRVVLTRFDEYYGKLPQIKDIKFLLYPDESLLLKEKSNVDVIPKASQSIAEALKESKFSSVFYSLPQYNAVFFNTEKEWLKEEKFRIALLKAVDKDVLFKVLENKDRVDTPLMELNQSDWIFKPNFNEANGALFDLGLTFPKDKDGKLIEGEPYRKNKSGNIVELNLVVRQFDEGTVIHKETQLTVDYLVKSWQKVGIKVVPTYVYEEEFLQKIQQRDYDLILTGQNMGYNFDTFPFWHSSQIGEAGLNLSNYKSFASDTLIEKLRATFDNDVKEKLLKDLAKVLADDEPAIFLYRPKYIFLSDGKVQGFYLNDLAFMSDKFFNVDELCIECNNQNP